MVWGIVILPIWQKVSFGANNRDVWYYRSGFTISVKCEVWYGLIPPSLHTIFRVDTPNRDVWCDECTSLTRWKVSLGAMNCDVWYYRFQVLFLWKVRFGTVWFSLPCTRFFISARWIVTFGAIESSLCCTRFSHPSPRTVTFSTVKFSVNGIPIQGAKKIAELDEQALT